MKWPLASQDDVDALVAAHQEHRAYTDKLEKRIAKLESLLVEATKRNPSPSAELRRPMNTWRTRATNYTKQSQADPSTFPHDTVEQEKS